jgi:Na+/proline symporter
MQLSTLDWIIVGAYLVFSLGVGVYYSRRAGKSPEEYYLAGRSLPWWILGTSMVATTFAADTPLAITEMSRSKGIWENWFWWNWLLYGMLAVFLFSRLWRRANILTENELLELRYSGRPAAFLRVFKAGYFAILYNFIVLGWVMLGMSSVLSVMLFEQPSVVFTVGGFPVETQDLLTIGLAIIATVYSLLSGFWGVVITDVAQFLIAIIGAVILAVIAVNHVGGMDSLLVQMDESLISQTQRIEDELAEMNLAVLAAPDEMQPPLREEISRLQAKLAQRPRDAQQAISLIPPFPRDTPVFSAKFLNTPFFQFMVLILVMWWSNHSTDGGGYLAQRTMAAKNEKHALLANLWYNFANYALRTWPWVIVALVSMVMFPDLSGQALGEKAGYPLVMKELLGSGMRGVLLISFLAAFMSTIDTHLNWASSYLVHDIYHRFMVRHRPDAHYVMVGRIVTVAIMVIAAVLSTQMGSIEKAWKFVMAMGGGIGLVLILRWFWWRINAWSEISALATSVIATVGFELLAARQTLIAGDKYVLFGKDPVVFGEPFPFHLQLLVIVFISLVTWLLVTYLTKPEPEKTLREFYALVQPGGWWGSIASSVPHTMQPVSTGFIGNFIAGLAFVWGGTFFIGYACFQNWSWALAMLAIMIGGFAWIRVNCLNKLEERPANNE